MKRQLRLRGAALSDLRRARSWYQRETPHMVDAFLEEFRSVISSIEERPLMYPSVAAHVRRALMTRFHYAIYFSVEEETIMVYAILHQARHEGNWMRRVPREKL